MILIFEMEKNIKIKLFDKSNLSSVLALIGPQIIQIDKKYHGYQKI